MSGNYRRQAHTFVEFYAECDICGCLVGPELTQAEADDFIVEHLMVDHKEQARLIVDDVPVTL